MLGMSPFGSASLWVATSSVVCLGLLPTILRLLDATFIAVLGALLLGGLVYLYFLWLGRDRIQLTAFRSIWRRAS
jgi:hypothetical protein